MNDRLEIARAWLPHPDFDFHGGPADGKVLTVSMIETDTGFIPPDIWQVPVKPDISLGIGTTAGIDAATAAFEIHEYRFVAAPGSINVGHYEWIKR